MRIATFLPHVGVFGGVRRFLELGNQWVGMGHDVVLYHPEGTAPGWLPYRGRVAALVSAAGESADLAIGADPHTFDAFAASTARQHLYYCVIESDPGVSHALATRGMRVAANSGPLLRALERRTRHAVVDGIGGINLEQFHPGTTPPADAPLRILLNGRRSRRKKGTDLVLSALRGLERETPAFEIVLFDTVDANNRQDPRDGAPLPENARFVLNPTQPELVALYQSAHVFIAAERKAGWCNTALEALACGTGLVCTPSGTTDFARDGENALVTWRLGPFLRHAARRMLRDDALRSRLAASGPPSVMPWSWERLAAKLLDQLAAG